jgi:hypothetical protein
VRYRATCGLARRWRKLSRSAFICLSRSLDLGLSDHNGAFVPYFAGDEFVTMDRLWRGEESVLQGKQASPRSVVSTLYVLIRRTPCALEK